MGIWIQTWGALIITGILAVAAVVAAVIAGRSANSTKKSVKAQVIWETLDEYSHRDMRDSIRALIHWKDKSPNDYGELFRFLAWETNNIQDVDKEDLARRHIALHFYKIWVLNKRGILDIDDVKELAERRQIETILLPLVEPLERDGYDTSMYDFFRSIYSISEKYR